MLRFEDIENIHFEITNRCQAKCPMCSRNYHGGMANPLIKNQDWTIDDYKKIITVELLQQLKGFYFCGNFGDPIINDDLQKMIEYSRSINDDLYVRIHTNGGARKKEWWQNLPKVLPKNHNVIFAIDGLEDTHSLYRIGTQFDIVLRNARDFIEAGGTAEWAFIKFKHNEHQVEQAEQRARQYGFARFTQKNSSRFVGSEKFEVLDESAKTVYYLEPPSSNKLNFVTKEVLDNYKTIVEQSHIDCYVKHAREIYIDAYKNVMPCCFLASIPYNYVGPLDQAKDIRREINEQYNDLISDLGNTNALEKPIREIIASTPWQTVWEKYWTTKKLITCARTCGVLPDRNLSKPKDQFVKVTVYDT